MNEEKKRKLKVSEESKKRLLEMKEILAGKNDDPDGGERPKLGCGGFCRTTCSYYCEDSCAKCCFSGPSKYHCTLKPVVVIV
ncbi:MAG: hypothetical protein GY765_14665 [bacterium]|nr:hypothetical protein [bacterium]